MTNENEIREQLCAFQEGDEVIWRQIVHSNSSWLYALCLRLLWNASEAEDAVQECFLNAFKGRKQLKNMHNLRSWLRTICVRICVKKCKKNKTVFLVEAEDFMVTANPVSPERLVTAKEEIKKVLLGLTMLSPRQMSCLILSVFEGLSMNEVSKTLGIREGTVKRYVFEARQFLKSYLKMVENNER